MSEPRQILPGSTYLVTRRCAERRHLLRPDDFVGLVFGYLLAVAARRYGVQVHAAVCLSNHYHAVVTDPLGRLPRFLMWLHRLVAVLVNIYRGRWEALWSSDKPSVVRLESPDDVLDKLVYVLSNPVAAGLVPSLADWPGFKLEPSSLCEPEGVEFCRPGVYFSDTGRMPRAVRLRVAKPPGFEHMTDEEFVTTLRERLAAQEHYLDAKMAADARSFLGAEKVMKVDWRSVPHTLASRRNLSPHIAARDPAVRRRAISRLKEFRASYRAARERWRRGRRRTMFPAGTYWFRVVCGVRCQPPPVLLPLPHPL